jgi:hypothetical protein
MAKIPEAPFRVAAEPIPRTVPLKTLIPRGPSTVGPLSACIPKP